MGSSVEQRRIVLLGAANPEKLAVDMPQYRFTNISLMDAFITTEVPNLTNKRMSYFDGICSARDESTILVSSMLRLGYQKGAGMLEGGGLDGEYLKAFFLESSKKLAPGGKLSLGVEAERAGEFQELLEQSGFKSERIQVWPFSDSDYESSTSARAAKRQGIQLSKVLAQKQGVVDAGLNSIVIVGGENVEDYARKNRHFTILNLMGATFTDKPFIGNLVNIDGDFRDELMKLEDGSQDLISSQMAFGYVNDKGYMPHLDAEYGEHVREYTREVFGLAYQKLRKGGKLAFTLDHNQLDLIRECIQENRQGWADISLTELDDQSTQRTPWMAKYKGDGFHIFEVTMTK